MSVKIINYFSVLNCNVKSVNANFDHLTQMLADLSFPFTLRLIGLTETWINNCIDQGIVHHLPGYTYISQPTSLRAGGGGGVGAFICNDVNFYVRADLSSSTDECEIFWKKL